MHVIHHATLPRHAEDGCCRQTVAGASICAAPFVVQTVAVEPGGATAPVTHAPALVIVALAGSGKLVLDSGPERFHAPCTLVVPAGTGHRFVNNGATPLQLVCVHATCDQPEVP
jgi:mannose-6-phosphate isomerase-like protein (cupin superfamily)